MNRMVAILETFNPGLPVGSVKEYKAMAERFQILYQSVASGELLNKDLYRMVEMEYSCAMLIWRADAHTISKIHPAGSVIFDLNFPLPNTDFLYD